ncbi:FKBP-type peptidyl-prolyl cis-trans isomerase SlyD [Archangium gephyra]|uniref:Peptidyl-prolyl cis-trans isomerase n=1 Tax=Archangium gephyra TaxID=48 RepID=A0AAC8TF35_9BACT|nr:peptidylprolyl isomerase [Archangium gephyra]AKJ03617.1 FKBP-type peptidyl-prolyl cis-trans isomerase SlyD [Archangium gephyra]REG22602.1 FKBP-type peptidyl-prolyl cis-trans isomerase SlyD [Archangium gephyra]
MQITKDSVVSIDYRLHLGDGKIIDESEAGDPLVYLHGYEEIVPGLEKALEGKKAGESLKVVVEPKDGYGEYDPDGVEEVPREDFPPDMELEAGGIVSATDEDGDDVEFLVKELRPKTVVIDFNDPMAGKTLHFEVTVREVRAATKEELEHGHAHGPGHEH